jgi:hypothetical protein
LLAQKQTSILSEGFLILSPLETQNVKNTFYYQFIYNMANQSLAPSPSKGKPPVSFLSSSRRFVQKHKGGMTPHAINVDLL